MAANTSPIYCMTGNIGFIQSLATAATAKDGTTATLLFTAATNGSRVEKILIRALGTNTATAFRLFVNNGSAVGTASNNTLIREMTIASTTLSEVAALADNEMTLNFTLPAGYKLYVAIGTTVAAGLSITAFGGDY